MRNLPYNLSLYFLVNGKILPLGNQGIRNSKHCFWKTFSQRSFTDKWVSIFLIQSFLNEFFVSSLKLLLYPTIILFSYFFRIISIIHLFCWFRFLGLAVRSPLWTIHRLSQIFVDLPFETTRFDSRLCPRASNLLLCAAGKKAHPFCALSWVVLWDHLFQLSFLCFLTLK